MKFVNNSFSTKMIKENTNVRIDIITEEEFNAEVHKEDVKSVVGHEDTANLFNLKFNRETLVLKPNDVLFVCEMNNDTDTRLPIGVTEMKELSNGVFFRFLKITVE